MLLGVTNMFCRKIFSMSANVEVFYLVCSEIHIPLNLTKIKGLGKLMIY